MFDSMTILFSTVLHQGLTDVQIFNDRHLILVLCIRRTNSYISSIYVAYMLDFFQKLVNIFHIIRSLCNLLHGNIFFLWGVEAMWATHMLWFLPINFMLNLVPLLCICYHIQYSWVICCFVLGLCEQQTYENVDASCSSLLDSQKNV